MNNHNADARALGFAALGILAWMLSMLYAGWYPASAVGNTITYMATLGIVALLVAGLVSFLRGDAWHAVFFSFWAAQQWGLKAGMANGGTFLLDYTAWLVLGLALVSLFLFYAARRLALGRPVLLLTVAFPVHLVLIALDDWMGGGVWLPAAGYVGLVMSGAAFWAMAVALRRLGSDSHGDGEPVSS